MNKPTIENAAKSCGGAKWPQLVGILATAATSDDGAE